MISQSGTAKPELGPRLASSEIIDKPCKRESWRKEWERCGGTGPVSKAFAENPTWWFTKPVDPREHGWTVGNTMLVVEIEQLLPSTEGWTSANFAFMRQRPPGDRCGYRPMQRAAVWHTNGRYSMDFFPTYLLGHKRPGSRMFIKGMPLMGHPSAPLSGNLAFNGDSRIRQLLPVPNHPYYRGKTVAAVEAMIFQWRRGTAGPITMRLARAGANPGPRTTTAPR